MLFRSDLLVDGSVTSARLVMNPQRMVVAEARRTFTYLSLFGYHLDAVVVNKVLPDGLDDPFLSEWRTAQKEQLEVVADSFAPLPVLRGPMSAREVIGIDELGAFADALYQDERAYGRLASIDPLRIEAVPGGTRLSVHLPFSGRHDVDLAQTDDELLVAVGPYRRAVVLPDSLRGRPVRRAAFADGRLQVEFDRSPREAR